MVQDLHHELLCNAQELFDYNHYNIILDLNVDLTVVICFFLCLLYFLSWLPYRLPGSFLFLSDSSWPFWFVIPFILRQNSLTSEFTLSFLQSSLLNNRVLILYTHT